ncbi:uncharacterized protein LOC131144835 [Malania oleifera]|uniref:uncharacterized protein LOC131144835 n=1 Tax=Malania oleifera TaxID=397392 RepID=UPI0025AE22A6|nr:uncharacterized protein LOC131144835 [Malania oleifera]
MAPSFTLLGPPEIHRPDPLAEAQPAAPATTGGPFVDLMVANFNNPPKAPLMGLTENNSPTFVTSGNPCLDFFFHVVPDTPPATLTELLDLSWNHDPLTTLKLVCNLRGVRGTGKSDKEGFYTAAFWLHQNHPKTLAGNIGPVAEFGYFKDFPKILYRLLEGSDVRQVAKFERLKNRMYKGGRAKCRRFPPIARHGRIKNEKNFNKSDGRSKSAVPREQEILAGMARVEAEKAKARRLRNDKKTAMARKVVERFNRDPDFQFLYEAITDLFSNHLRSDIQFLNSGETRKISLAAKWCPSLDSSFDKSTLLCESIARKVFPRESHPEYEGIEDAHYAYRVRDRLRKQALVPLRKALDLPEIYMSANQWGSIPYNRVSSVAMKNYKEHFSKHDAERFADYLEKVKAGKAKIAAGALLPHEIIASLDDGDDGAVAELQWRRIVEDLSKKGKLRNCLAICDVSGSMCGIPMEVSVALGILVSELSEEPWKGKLITFSECPQLHKIEGDDLRTKKSFVSTMEWGMNTNFQKVFDRILDVAVNGKLREDQMIKRVFVFSDMEFDEASANPWETDYEAIRRKFEESGYGSAVPEIVFWNLRASKATPVPSHQKGVALVSGFSKNLLTLFLEGDGVLSPEEVMEAAISGDEYKKLVVLD